VLKPVLLAPIAFVFAALLSALIAWGAAILIERVTATSVKTRLLTEGIGWVDVQADGLQVKLIGTAPNEASRYRTVNIVSSMVESSRVRDELEVLPVKEVEAPRFSLEILRNDDGIQLIGLLPAEADEQGLLVIAQDLMPDIPLMEMIETSSYPAPSGWSPALAYGIEALKLLPRSKISVAADRVLITAIASSEQQKRQFEAELLKNKPRGLQVNVDVSAPRPVLTPFTLRFVKSENGVEFDACAADSDRARAKILTAARDAGIDDSAKCVIGLGVPTPSWGDAAAAGIRAIAQLKSGTITFKDADVTLLAGTDVTQAEFDRVLGDLEAELPDVFSLDATLEVAQTQTATAGPAEFTAILAEKTGRIELRGRLTDAIQRQAVESYAKAAFGVGNVYQGARLDPELPDGWPLRVLAGLQAFAELEYGSLIVRADTVVIKGVTGSQTARARIAQILSGKLGQGKTFKVEVVYDEALDPLAALPTPQECIQSVKDVLAKQKIAFKPGSTEIDNATDAVMNALALALVVCPPMSLEIAGHTDAQGSSEGNRSLSQARAEAVLVALQGRKVDVSRMTAMGYGEDFPLGDNETELGREANRRIEFNPIGPEAGSAVVQPASGDGQAGNPAAPAQPAVSPETAADAAPATAAANDQSPSVAPVEKTRRAKPRPKVNP
jgi:OOP family OmpA-OmpF porin